MSDSGGILPFGITVLDAIAARKVCVRRALKPKTNLPKILERIIPSISYADDEHYVYVVVTIRAALMTPTT